MKLLGSCLGRKSQSPGERPPRAPGPELIQGFAFLEGETFFYYFSSLAVSEVRHTAFSSKASLPGLGVCQRDSPRTLTTFSESVGDTLPAPDRTRFRIAPESIECLISMELIDVIVDVTVPTGMSCSKARDLVADPFFGPGLRWMSISVLASLRRRCRLRTTVALAQVSFNPAA